MSETTQGLGDRLVAVALELLKQQPAEALSLRGVAVELGVSHQAPYVHFGNKRQFLAAVAGAGLERAATDAAAAVAAAGSDPLERLHALAGSYVAFVRGYPHVHDLAYGPLLSKGDHPHLQRAASTYWDLLNDTVAACQPPGIGEDEVLRRSAATWGTVYGIARLTALGQIPAAVPVEDDGLLHSAVDTLYDGWRSGSTRSH